MEKTTVYIIGEKTADFVLHSYERDNKESLLDGWEAIDRIVNIAYETNTAQVVLSHKYNTKLGDKSRIVGTYDSNSGKIEIIKNRGGDTNEAMEDMVRVIEKISKL